MLLGAKHTPETLLKFRNRIPWNKGKKLHYTVWAKANPGYKQTEVARRNMCLAARKYSYAARLPHPTGEQHPLWKGGYRNTLLLNLNYRARRRGAKGSHTLKEWEQLKSKLGHRCASCRRTDISLTTDHILPLSKGGTNNIVNIQPLCGLCNSIKGARTINFIPLALVS